MKNYQKELKHLLREPDEGPELVVIGGGTGLSTMLRGLKRYSENITAIVTVADDGGSSGLLRQDYGVLPPGDIRNCILALADTERVMEELINFRFTEGQLQGQNFGNLFLTALTAISGNFYDAIRNFSSVLAVNGRVLPVSLTDLNISAELADGGQIHGESNIGERPVDPTNPIRRIYMEPADAEPLMEAVEAIRDADLVVLGPGSLYTSVIPNLLFPAIVQALKETQAPCVYVCNIMTQPAETAGYSCQDHVRAILEHAGEVEGQTWLDFCIANSAPISDKLQEKYQQTQSELISYDAAALADMGVRLLTSPLVAVRDERIRHDADILAQQILRLALDSVEHKLEQAATRVYRPDEDEV